MSNKLSYSKVSETERESSGHEYRINFRGFSIAQVSRTKNGFEGQTIGVMKKRNIQERTMKGVKAQLQDLISHDKRPAWRKMIATT